MAQVDKKINFNDLELMLSELNCKQPNWAKIRTLADQNGLPFEKDSIKQIDSILKYLDSMRFKKNQPIEL